MARDYPMMQRIKILESLVRGVKSKIFLNKPEN